MSRAELAITIVTLALAVAYMLLFAEHCQAQTETERRNALWLARAGVSEVGWARTKASKDEQSAVWHVLKRRWRRMARIPGIGRLELSDMVRLYCAGLGNKQWTPRQRWVRNLSWERGKPDGWPKNADWKVHEPLWHDTLKRAMSFLQGKSRNPCAYAEHFGSRKAGDYPRGRMRLHQCSVRFENQFYTIAKEE